MSVGLMSMLPGLVPDAFLKTSSLPPDVSRSVTGNPGAGVRCTALLAGYDHSVSVVCPFLLAEVA